MKRYSANFERDYAFYYGNRNVLTFTGQADHPVEYDPEGMDAKQAFHVWDSQGKLIGTKDPELLSSLIRCKKSVNFHIKQWAGGYREGTLLLMDLEEIQEIYSTPDWVIKAIKHQGKRTPKTLIFC